MNTTHWPEGIKKTKQREAIWSVLNSTDKPITAIEIAERLGDGSTTWMSTIYRTLELLETKDIVTRTTIMGSDMAYYEITPHMHRHYAVCTKCGRNATGTYRCRVYSNRASLRNCGNLQGL